MRLEGPFATGPKSKFVVDDDRPDFTMADKLDWLDKTNLSRLDMGELLNAGLTPILEWIKDVKTVHLGCDEELAEKVATEVGAAKEEMERERDLKVKGLQWEIDSLKKELKTAKREATDAEDRRIESEERYNRHEERLNERATTKQTDYENVVARLRSAMTRAMERVKKAED
jgi:hypothetical protein